MILDKQLMLSEAQAITVTAVSTNVIDLSQVRDIGNGEPLELIIAVKQTFTAGGAATLTIDLQTDDNVGFASPVVLASTGALALAALTAGVMLLQIKIPLGVERFLRLNYTVATGPMTAGILDAGINLDRTKYTPFYPSGVPVGGF